MFVDKSSVVLKAGDGGNGIVSFRHEKFIDKGGPDGGDGGKGGDIVLHASRNQNTLASFRYQRLLKAPSGKPGGMRNKRGRSGQDLIVDVPVGTTVLDMEGKLLADLTEDGQKVVIAKGGIGGFGNAHFTSSIRQAPRVAEKGEEGQELQATLELKMIADVGLVGLPNAGKSTFLASVSNARPEIANYPFTTLTPNLGVVDVDKGTTLLFADIPGLIEGASQGKGLGVEFLRHVERTLALVHLIDVYHDDIAEAYQTIQNELKAYQVDLTERPQIVALNKIEGLDDEIVADKLKELKKVVPKGTPLFAISGASKQGMPELLYALKDVVTKERTKVAEVEENQGLPVIQLDADLSWHITKTEDGFIVSGAKIERFARKTDFESPDALRRLRDIMQKMGIMNGLYRQGIEAEQTITIGKRPLGTIKY
ncbi:MAG: GTPase ObgE [Candidatus Saccharibacteria bacterium]|nr:GTPase ObgE [Candidatus Saccharibacteria bacterium]